MASRTILIIEDEEMLLKYLSGALEKSGFSVLKSTTATSGFEAAEENLPDLILLDILLPGGSGEDLLKKLKETPATKDIPVVILTNLADEETKARCEKLGCADYITKADYRLDQMVEKVKEICKKLCEELKP